MTAAIAGKPSPTNNGTATAAGVPNPAEPSINAPNNQAMMMTWTRRSDEMLVKPARMAYKPPLSCSVFKSAIAPFSYLYYADQTKIINISVAATTTPLIVAAATTATGTCQTNRHNNVQTTYASGIARLAGQRRPTRNTATNTIGKMDRRDSTPVVINPSIREKGICFSAGNATSKRRST